MNAYDEMTDLEKQHTQHKKTIIKLSTNIIESHV